MKMKEIGPGARPLAVADPGFPQGGVPIPKLGLFCKFFAENCMKMKEFGPLGEGHASLAPPRSANVKNVM